MKGLYSFSTTIPLDVNGNPTEEPCPTTAEILTTSALLNCFFGSRFLIEEDGRMQRIGNYETLDQYEFVEAINFHPIASAKELLKLVFLTQMSVLSFESVSNVSPRIIKRYREEFGLSGVGVISRQEYFFTLERNGVIKMHFV